MSAKAARGTGRLADMVANTPPTRDRFVDFLRAASILVVVFGHWTIGLIYWHDGVIGTTNVIGRQMWLWPATWLLQVMGIFFFVGGFSNLVTYRSFLRKGRSTGEFLRTRAARLLKPSLVFLAVWIAVQAGLHLFEIGRPTSWGLRGMQPPGATVPFGPLWFLAVYLGVVLISPAMIRLHERFGLAAPVAMGAGIIAADVVGFIGGIENARWLNGVLVWLLPHQLGFFYADGKIGDLSRKTLALIAAGGLAVMLLLTNPIFGEAGDRWFEGVGHYPRSLLGTDVEPISNAYPPTIPLAAMGLWSIALVLLVRPKLTAWLERPGLWKATILINSRIMTLFLWHMTAFLVAVLVLWPLGFGRTGDLGRWWLERPLWLGASAAILAGLVTLFGRFERA